MADPIFAVVTPFQSDSARALDLAALRDLLAFLAGRGVRRIVAGGTTGEFPALTAAERRTLLEECRHAFPGQVIAHISSPCAAEAREALAHARHWADAALLLPPYYFASPPVEGVAEFLVSVTADSPLPVYLYNFPRHTQVTLTADLVEAVRRHAPSVRGLKDSGGDLASAVALKQRLGPEFEVYLGADSLARQALEAGLDGSVTGGGQPMPECLVDLAACHRAGDSEGAARAQSPLDAWTAVRKRFTLPEPALIKAALGARLPGFPTAVRAPFVAADGNQIQAIRRALDEVLTDLKNERQA